MQHVEIAYLDPNTTSVLQPCDAGIIHAFKCHYRRAVLRHLINSSATQASDKIDLYKALLWIREAWKTISVETIRNCWLKTQLLPPKPDDFDIPQIVDGSQIMNEIEEMIIAVTSDGDKVSSAEYVDSDKHTEVFDSEVGFLDPASPSLEPAQVVEDEEEESIDRILITRKEAVQYAQDLQYFLVCRSWMDDNTFDSLSDLVNSISLDLFTHKKQSLMTNYFEID